VTEIIRAGDLFDALFRNFLMELRVWGLKLANQKVLPKTNQHLVAL
jgi:hypothetical protein